MTKFDLSCFFVVNLYREKNMNKIYGIVYKPENRIIYVGQTIQAGRKRWWDHLREAYEEERKDKLHTFIRTHSSNEFDFITIKELDCSKKELNDLEEFYIKEFDTIDNGLNTLGKSNCINLNVKGKTVLWFNNNREYVKSFNSIVDAASASGVSTINVSHCCNHYQTKTTQGWFRFEGDLTPLEDSYRLGVSLEVEKLDPFTFEVIKTYPSLQQAEKEEKITCGYLSAVCLGKRYSAKGFPYRYKSIEKRKPYSGGLRIKTGVAQVDKDSKIVIAKFLTCEDAAKITNLRQDTITRARHTNRVSLGFIWVDARNYRELLEKGEIFENDNTKTYY